MREAATSDYLQQSTGTYGQSTEGDSLTVKLGQALMVVSGAALVALAARDRSWRTIGMAAVAGAPLLYKSRTGKWPLPEAVQDRVSTAVAPVPIEASMTIGRPASEIYAFWRKLENLSRFMENVESVTELDDRRSHWVAKSPLGMRVEWDAEIVEEAEGRLLSWRSLPGSEVHNAGTVFFEDAPAGRGTVLRVNLELSLASGLGQAIGKVLKPITKQQVREDLRRLKGFLETGEIPTIDGQTHGTRSLIGRIHNPL